MIKLLMILFGGWQPAHTTKRQRRRMNRVRRVRGGFDVEYN